MTGSPKSPRTIANLPPVPRIKVSSHHKKDLSRLLAHSPDVDEAIDAVVRAAGEGKNHSPGERITPTEIQKFYEHIAKRADELAELLRTKRLAVVEVLGNSWPMGIKPAALVDPDYFDSLAQAARNFARLFIAYEYGTHDKKPHFHAIAFEIVFSFEQGLICPPPETHHRTWLKEVFRIACEIAGLNVPEEPDRYIKHAEDLHELWNSMK